MREDTQNLHMENPKSHRIDKPISVYKDHAENFFILEGSYWKAGFQGRSTTIKDTQKIRYIVHLLNNPGKQIHVFDMMNLVKRNVIEKDVGAISKTNLDKYDHKGNPELKRAIMNVYSQIRLGITTINLEGLRDLGTYLNSSIRTGVTCSYI